MSLKWLPSIARSSFLLRQYCCTGVAATRLFTTSRIPRVSNIGVKNLHQRTSYNDSKPRQKMRKEPKSPKLTNLSYEQLGGYRRQQAAKSVLIQVPGRFCTNYVYNYCSEFGDVKMFYECNVKDYLLVEFDSEKAALSMCSSAGHFETDNFPVETRVLYLVNPGVSDTVQTTAPVVQEAPRGVQLPELYNASDINEQIQIYYHAERLTELETRLRYFVCSLLEDALTPLFPLVTITPYGSSANGLGRHGCDLDMVLNLNTSAQKVGRVDSPFRYMTKIVDDERVFTQKSLRIIADILQVFVPHIQHVQKIVHARVPIINFYHDSTSTSCDLSLSNDSVLVMSKLLYLLCDTDIRIRPIIFALRRWASQNDLTLNRPGPRFSNFMLTLMLLAYLQLEMKVLPPLSRFLRQDSSGDFTCVDKISKSGDTYTAEDILIGFFNFYAEFDFSKHGISLFRAELIEKPASIPLSLENPLDHEHNSAQNVHQKELEYLQSCLRTGRDRLLTNRTKSSQSWGLLTLVESRNFGSDVNIGINIRKLFS